MHNYLMRSLMMNVEDLKHAEVPLFQCNYECVNDKLRASCRLIIVEY
jgi:hypothetical protein